MLETIFTSLEDTFVKLDLRRFIFWIIFIIMLGIGLWVFELYTNYGFYYRLDEYLSTLEKLKKLRESGIMDSAELKPLYDKAVTDLNAHQVASFSMRFNGHLILELTSATWICWLFMVHGIIKRLGGDKGSTNLILGTCLMIIFFVLLVLIIPLPCSWWLSCLLYLSLQFLVLLILARSAQKQT